MKVTRAYLGRVCRITWEDPVSENDRIAVTEAAKGKKALAKWVEYGLIDDITEGVVRFRHSESYDPGEGEVHEALFGWVVEDLITEITPLIPEQLPNG